MSSQVKPIPDGYSVITPYLIVNGAADAIEFYKQAFGAVETMRLPWSDGKLGHAEIRIGGATVMLADEAPEWDALSPQTLGGAAVSLMLHVGDVDVVFKRAIAAGAKSTREVSDQFYGDRTGTVTDPFGHRWHIATHIEDVAPEEMTRRAAKMAEQAG